jgi:signal transduction histidine kinase/ActR/RegA family two-component response regulator
MIVVYDDLGTWERSFHFKPHDGLVSPRKRIPSVRLRGTDHARGPRAATRSPEPALFPAVQALLQTATAILSSSLSLESALRLSAEQARALVGTHAGVVTLSLEPSRTMHAFAGSEEYASWRDGGGEPARWLVALAARLPLPACLSTAQLEAHPSVRELKARKSATTPLRGLLAAPLVSRTGQPLGSIALTAKIDGEFTDVDLAHLGFVADIASLVAESAHLYEQAQESNRLKDEFLTTLSHELRTPLNAIVGWAHLLRSGHLSREEVSRAIAIIERNAKAQTQLISDVLDVSRIVSGRLRLNVRPVRVGQVIDETIESLRTAAAAKRIQIRKEVDATAGPVLADPDRLRQILWNCVSNAIKFTPERGHVIVRLSVEANEALLSVSDDGIGIPQEFMPHVFDRFRQADSTSTRSYGGLGLGLALVRHLTELHGGRVEAESAGDGKGATFRVRLPLLVAEPRADAARRSVEPQLGGLRILLVDSDADMLEVIKTVLQHEKAEVRAVPHGREAIREIESQKVDVLISNLRLSDIDGYSLIQAVRALGPDRGGGLPAIALTGHLGTEDLQRAFLAGFQAHLAKPVNPAELVAVVATLAPRVS